MPKKDVLQQLNPKSKGKVQKSKVQKSMTLVATSAMLAEREYTYEQNMVVHTMDQGIDRNMIKTEEIKLEAKVVEGEDINQFSTNSVHITSDKLIKNEPESFLGTEAFSHPTPTKSTASIPARKKRKNVAKEMLKMAEQQRKRQEKRSKNSNRHKENTAQLPDYRECSRSLNQEPSDTNLTANAGMERQNDTNIDIGDGQESNTGDADTRNMHLLDSSMEGGTNQNAHSTSIDETKKLKTGIDVDEIEELGTISTFYIDSESNRVGVEAHKLHFSDTYMASDTIETVHSTSTNSGTKISEKSSI